MGKNHYEGDDAVRNVIKSHNTMLVSIPREIAMRAGLTRGVTVRADQDPKNPGTITLKAINPADLSKELKAYLKEANRRAANHKAKADRKAAREKAAKKKAEETKAAKDQIKATEPETAEEPVAETPE